MSELRRSMTETAHSHIRKLTAARRLGKTCVRLIGVLGCASILWALPAGAAENGQAAVATAATVAPGTVSLSGMTLDSVGHALGGVEARLQGKNPETGSFQLYSARSGDDGKFSFGGLTPGFYRVIAVKGGFSVLVGQINTVLQNSLQLVLKPAGNPGAPGTVPDDQSWALRLPKRDRLEDQSTIVSLDGVESESSQHLPLSFELATRHLSGTTGTGRDAMGFVAGLRGAFELPGVGQVGLGYRFEGETSSGVREDEYDAFLIQLVPYQDSSSVPVALQFDAATRDRLRRQSSQSADLLDATSEVARVQASWGSMGKRGLWHAHADLSMFEGFQAGQFYDPASSDIERSSLDYDSHYASLAARREHFWSDSHHLVVSGSLNFSSGGSVELIDGSSLVLVPLAAHSLGPALTLQDGPLLDLGLEDRWADSEKVQVVTRARFESGTLADDRLRASASTGARIALPASMNVGFDAGVTVDDVQNPEPVWGAQFGRATSSFAWQIERRSRLAFDAGDAIAAEQSRSAMNSPFGVSKDGRIDSWGASAVWQPFEGWPVMRLEGSHFDVEGGLVARITRDVAVVPIDEFGRGRGVTLDLSVDHVTTGTAVRIAWTEIEDRTDNGALLSGAEAWDLQQIHLRQRLGSGALNGASWQLIVAVERGEVSMPGGEQTIEDGRLALLSERRISGGVALAF